MLVCLPQSEVLAADAAPLGGTAGTASASTVVAPARSVRVSTVTVDPETGKLVRVQKGSKVTGRSSAATRKAIAAAQAVARETPSVEREEIHELIEKTAKRHGVDADLVHSVIRVESNYQQKAISSKGALGLMQLIPSTAARFGVENPFDAGQNLEGGVRYLKFLTERFGGDLQLALAAYNAGEGAVTRHGGIPPYRETQDYVSRVTRNLDHKAIVGTTGHLRDFTNGDGPETKSLPETASAEEDRTAVAAAPRQAAVRMYTDSEGRLHLETIP